MANGCSSSPLPLRCGGLLGEVRGLLSLEKYGFVLLLVSFVGSVLAVLALVLLVSAV